MPSVRFSRADAKTWAYAMCLGVFTLMGCTAEPIAVAQDAAKPPPPFEVELVGAKAWRRNAPPIFSDEKRPRIIYPAEIGVVQAFVEDRPATLKKASTSAGHVAYEVVFEAPEGAFELRVVDAAGRDRRWTLSWLDEKSAALIAPIEALIAKARKARQAGLPEADALRREAAALAEAADLPSIAATQWLVIAFHALRRTDLSAHAAAVEAAEALLGQSNQSGRLGVDYERGLSAKLSGELHRADASLARTSARARHLGESRYHHAAEMARANVQVRQGRFGAALSAYGHLQPGPDASARALQFWHNNVAWAMALGMEGGALPQLPSIAAWHLNEALANTVPPPDRANVLANLAGVELQMGRVGAARSALELAVALDARRTSFGTGWRDLMAAEISLACGDFESAEDAFLAAARAGPTVDAPDPETGWRAIAGLARLYDEMGDQHAAKAMFEEAGRRVDRLAAGVEFASTSGAFYAGRRQMFDAWALFSLRDTSLPEAQRPAASWAVIEASQARIIRSLQRQAAAKDPRVRAQTHRWLEARARFESARAKAWSVPAAERTSWRARRSQARQALDQALLALLEATPRTESSAPSEIRDALPPNTIVLSYRRLGASLHGFLIERAAVHHRVVVGGNLLGPWRQEIRAATHVFWIAGGVSEAEHLEQHELEGQPLAAVVSQSRLPFAGLLLAQQRPTSRPAVVVADPEGNLEWARTEATGLAGTRLSGDSAHRGAVLRAIDGTRLMHFAGHGVLHTDSPWDAHLRLAGQTRLTLGDVLTARPAVGTVVLNGCSTGVALDLGGEERIGLPTAFLLAGARAVVATRVDIADADARRFIDRFYSSGGAERPALAFRDAVRTSEAAGDRAWTHFELMGQP